MKRLCSILLAVTYLAYAGGVTIYHHYCMGELVSTSMFATTDSACGKCGMKTHVGVSEDCCKDIAVNVKTNESHLYSQVLFDTGFDYILCLKPAFTLLPAPAIQGSVLYTSYVAHAPPFKKEALFLHNRNFRI